MVALIVLFVHGHGNIEKLVQQNSGSVKEMKTKWSEKELQLESLCRFSCHTAFCRISVCTFEHICRCPKKALAKPSTDNSTHLGFPENVLAISVKAEDN
jgi:hypothetical protein